MAEPLEVLRGHVARARSVYANHATIWSALGAIGLVLSAATCSTSAKLSGMAAGLAFALPVGIAMLLRWRALGEGGAVLRLLEEPRRIVWHFVRMRSVQGRAGNEVRRHVEMVLGDEDGELSSFWIEERSADKVTAALSALAPHATSGYSETLARAFHAEPLDLRRHLATPDEDRANEGARPYRDAPPVAEPAGGLAAREERRRARRARKRRNVAVAIAGPLALVCAWGVGARLESDAGAGRERARAAWWRERADAVIARELEASSAATSSEEFVKACYGRLEDQDWAAVAFATDGPQRVERLEARGSRSMSSFGPPWQDYGRYAPTTTLAALGTAPWRWTIVAGERPEPLFSGRLLGSPDEEDPKVLVRMVDRESGALLCQGEVSVGFRFERRPCSKMEGYRDALECAEAEREGKILRSALENAVRVAMWPD